MTKSKKLKIEFAPGSFDNFDGTQEELDALQKEIIDMFANMTAEQIRANSRPVNMETLEFEDPELYEILAKQTEPRNLQ